MAKPFAKFNKTTAFITAFANFWIGRYTIVIVDEFHLELNAEDTRHLVHQRQR